MKPSERIHEIANARAAALGVETAAGSVFYELTPEDVVAYLDEAHASMQASAPSDEAPGVPLCGADRPSIESSGDTPTDDGPMPRELLEAVERGDSPLPNYILYLLGKAMDLKERAHAAEFLQEGLSRILQEITSPRCPTCKRSTGLSLPLMKVFGVLFHATEQCLPQIPVRGQKNAGEDGLYRVQRDGTLKRESDGHVLRIDLNQPAPPPPPPSSGAGGGAPPAGHVEPEPTGQE